MAKIPNKMSLNVIFRMKRNTRNINTTMAAMMPSAIHCRLSEFAQLGNCAASIVRA